MKTILTLLCLVLGAKGQTHQSPLSVNTTHPFYAVVTNTTYELISLSKNKDIWVNNSVYSTKELITNSVVRWPKHPERDFSKGNEGGYNDLVLYWKDVPDANPTRKWIDYFVTNRTTLNLSWRGNSNLVDDVLVTNWTVEEHLNQTWEKVTNR